jgi:hypothetical protein
MKARTIQEFVLDELNRMLEEEGRDVRVAMRRPRPRLATDGGNVVELRPAISEEPDPTAGPRP